MTSLNASIEQVQPIFSESELDAFSRLRVSNPVSLFEGSFQYNNQPLRWETFFTGSGTETTLPNYSAIQLNTTTASGDKATKQTHEYFRYQNGKSHLVLISGIFGAPQTNLRRRIGHFDDNNGLYFEQTTTGLSVNIRSSVSGSV